MTVEVEKSYLIRRNEDNLHLNNFEDPSCSLKTHSNTTHLVAVVPLNTCGTVIDVMLSMFLSRLTIESIKEMDVASGSEK